MSIALGASKDATKFAIAKFRTFGEVLPDNGRDGHYEALRVESV